MESWLKNSRTQAGLYCKYLLNAIANPPPHHRLSVFEFFDKLFVNRHHIQRITYHGKWTQEG